MIHLWRIAAETRDYAADDLTGRGAAKFPGRWNTPSEHLIYTAPTIALAVLETAAHIVDAGLPQNRFLVQLQVPTAVWDAREERPAASLPASWNAIPAGKASSQIGSAWLAAAKSPILLLPSVIVPEEHITLINPAHPLSASIKASIIRKFEYNSLFRAG